MEKLFMADLRSNGLQEKLCYVMLLFYINKSRLDVKLVKKIAMEMIKEDERRGA